MKHIVIGVCGVVVVGAAYGLGYFMRPVEVITDERELVVREVKAGDSAEAELLSLRQQLDAANAELAALRKEAAEEPVEAEKTEVAEQPQERERRDFNPIQRLREREERMKKEDPERYAEMQKQREEFVATVKGMQQERQNFLDAIDLSLLTEEQQKVHTTYADAVAKRSELMDYMMSLRNSEEAPTPEAMQEVFTQMRETSETIRELQESERANLLSASVQSMGLGSEDAEQLTSVIEAIVQNTSDQMIGPGGPGGPGRRGGQRSAGGGGR